MSFDPAEKIQALKAFGEFGGVNPSITDSSTYTFLTPNKMLELFESEIEGCFLYSRHFNPINKYLCDALASMENMESAQVTSSGMGAITSTILQLCSAGDELIAGWTIYGGTYAFLANVLPRFGIKVKFVDITDLEKVTDAITENTKLIYCETISNPLMEVADIKALSMITKKNNIKLVVDNTFSPMVLTPGLYGADIVVHSLTKFINGTSDCVAGVICSTKEFIAQVTDINTGTCMLLGPVLDSMRAGSILKNLHSLHLRMKKHSENASYLAKQISNYGVKVYYPGLESHPQHKLISEMINRDYGYSGMMVVDAGDSEKANKLMEKMQNTGVGYLAVSLGYFKTLFSSPASSTSSEIPEERRNEMGLSDGMIRLSVGLDSDIENTYKKIEECLKALKL